MSRSLVSVACTVLKIDGETVRRHNSSSGSSSSYENLYSPETEAPMNTSQNSQPDSDSRVRDDIKLQTIYPVAEKDDPLEFWEERSFFPSSSGPEFIFIHGHYVK